MSIYIHIPFCSSICSYCDFSKMLSYKKFINPYLMALENEIKDKYQDELVDTIYIGGGTPSCLVADDLKELFKIINIFKKNDTIEFTFECNVNDINAELLTILKDNGVNRLSIGVQSFNEKNLKTLGRRHSFETVKKAIELARRYGFNNINIDLIYAVPNETLSILKKDLNLILKLKPEHISTYSLIFEKNTILDIKNIKPISEELDAKMYNLICKKLTKQGFLHYEISNFAKSGFESRHNLTYWHNEEYYGFGLGAHGYIHGVRYENTKNMKKYLNEEYESESNLISKTVNMENELMLGLRLMQGVNIEKFYKKYNININEVFPIEKMLNNKNLVYKDGYISISPDKIYLMNEILIELF